MASAGDEAEPLAAVTVTVCGTSASVGVKVSVVVDSTPAGLVVEIVSGTVTLAVGTDWSTTVNDDPAPPCITLGICAGAITIPSTGTMCRSPTETLPRTAPPDGVPSRSGMSTGGRGVRIVQDRDGDGGRGRAHRERDGGVHGRVVHASVAARVVGRERDRKRLAQVAASRERDRGRAGGLRDVVHRGGRAGAGRDARRIPEGDDGIADDADQDILRIDRRVDHYPAGGLDGDLAEAGAG